MSLRSVLFAATLLSFEFATSGVHAGIIVDQSSGQSSGIISDRFTDIPNYNTYSFDDFTLNQAYNLTTLTVFGTDFGTGGNLAVTAEIHATSDITSPALLSASGTETAGNLNFNFAGGLLGPGSYWLTAYVTRNYSVSGSAWYFNTRLPVTGSAAFVQNLGGGYGHGTSPQPISVYIGVERDLAFTLSGNLAAASVPEPASLALALIGIGLPSVALALRKRRAELSA